MQQYWEKKKRKNKKPFLIIATNFNGLDTHRKCLFSLIIVVKVLLVVVKSHNFLKRKISEIPKIWKFLRNFWLKA